MTQNTREVEKVTPRTGHRPGRNPDEPRNYTVCFMVSESERAVIDAFSLCSNRRRSAILTEIVTRFMAAAEVSRGTSKRTALIDFLEDCQDEITEKRELFNTLKEKA